MKVRWRARVVWLFLLALAALQSRGEGEPGVPGRHRQVSRITRGLRLHRRQLHNGGPNRNRFPGPGPHPGDLDPIPDGPRVSMPRMEDMRKLVQEAAQAVSERLQAIEPKIFHGGVVQRPGSPGWFAAAMAKTKVAAKNFSGPALIAEEATRLAADRFGLNREQITFGLPSADVRGTLLGDICPLEVDFPCQPAKYRAYSGYCNNVQNPTWGNANTRYLRYLPPDYGDGISDPRVTSEGHPLPSGRTVSLSVHGDADKPHQHLTALLAIFSEFVAHDLAHTAQTAGFRGHRIRCCGVDSRMLHPECLPIPLDKSDPVYGQAGMDCMDYVRSSTAPRIGCTLGPREQINQVTSFLDGSVVYGSSEDEANALRTFRGGQLRTQRGVGRRSGNAKELLPAEEDSQDCRSSSKCFLAGDVRVNENAGLMVMHTLWVREHNRLARILSRVNPHWNDDELFEESRRIVGAQLQHITYNELLPALLGTELSEKFDLLPRTSGFFTRYDINVNPGLSNAVATSVLGLVFSMMPSRFDLVSSDLKKLGSKNMGQTSFQTADFYSGGDMMDQYLMGMVNQKAQSRDEFISDEMTNGLFADPKTGVGADMAAMLIHQGREHGIPGYLQWRKFCRLDPIFQNFADLEIVMSPETVQRLQRTYKRIEDIDLFTGGLAEKPVMGAAVGPTFGCLMGRQFHYLRRGDRFWYENDLPPSSFSKEQLMEIRKSTLARILCDNADGLHFMQPATLRASDPFLNAFQSCDTENIPDLDLSKWQQASPRFQVPDGMLQESMKRAKRQVAEFQEAQEESFANNVGVAEPGSPQAAHLGFLRPKRQARVISNQSLVLELASQGFAGDFLKSPTRDRESVRGPNSLTDLMKAMPKIDVSELLDVQPRLDDECSDQTLPCDHTSRFRSMTGWCNNLDQPDLGRSLRAFNRLLPARYADGMSSPRTRGVSGNPLPTPRSVSTAVHYDVSAPHVRYSLMVMQWGQFLDHDITFTPMNEGVGGSALNCKDCESTRTVHPECLPIPIPRNDPFYPPVNLNNGQNVCLSFVRSLSGQLKLGPREQLNQVTGFLDASNVYGSDNCDGKVLRSFIGGRMNVTRTRGKDLLPQTAFHKECRAPSRLCFEAGDSRASEQPALAAMHTLLLREHNRIADGLQQVNPHWSDEQLYQNARRILSALEQHITYNEFLPRVLGLEFVNRFGLRLLPEGYYTGYDRHCDPTVFNEFGTAAFRFGHSLIKPILERFERGYRPMSDPLLLRKGFFNSDMLFAANAIDHIMRGLVTSSMETLDNSITEEVTNHLFEDSRVPFSGMDLASLNLQRGRDHGIAPYNDYRRLCNLTRARTFDDLSREIPKHLIDRLKAVYENVDDIELFTGGLIETPLHGGLVGPTFGCIIGLQFRHLRQCDRFWYESANPLLRFTEAQLASLREMTLSKVICDNTDTVESVQRSAMDQPDPFLNPRVSCDRLPSLGLDKWRERVTCTVQGITIDVGDAERISPCVMCTCTKEGPICQSLRINNCFQLASTFSKESILSDHVCKVQCAFSFRAFPQVDVTSNSVLGFSNN